MKTFDLQEAKNGALLCTRDGRNARIICDDKQGGDHPIVALISPYKKGEQEIIREFTIDGFIKSARYHSCYDLFLQTDHDGWINCYINDQGKVYADPVLYNTEDHAKNCILNNNESCGKYLLTQYIDWAGLTKQCPHCKRILPKNEFSESTKTEDNLQIYCKRCTRIILKNKKVLK